ncbi:MAG: hypothetical protein ACFFCD_15525 [Promethearchaeota archaeon]
MKLEKYDKYLLLLILASVCVSLIAHFYDYTFYKGDFIINGWSRTYDVPEHLIYTIEILRGNWPFQNPMIVGASINYPIAFSLLVAIFVRISGAPVLQVFRFFSIALIIFVGLTSYIMVSSLFNNKRIAFYTTLFVLFSGGYGWVTVLFPFLGLPRSIDFFPYYYCMIDTFFFYSILISVNLFRPLSRTLGIGLFYFYFYFLNSFLKSNKSKYLVFDGIVLGVLINSSPGMAIELFILSIMALVYFKQSLHNILKYFLIHFAILPVFTIQLLLESVSGTLTGSMVINPGRYISPIFYTSLFGIAFVLMIIGILFYPMKEKKTRNFLYLWLLIALFLANVALIAMRVQSTISVLLLANSHIFSLLLNVPFYIFSSLGLVKILDFKPSTKWSTPWHFFRRYGVPLLIIACSLSVLRMVYINGYAVNDLSTAQIVYTAQEQEYTALIWVRENTELDAMFLTYHYTDLEATRIAKHPISVGRGHSWVADIGQRRVLLNRQGHFLIRGIDYREFLRIGSDIDLIYTTADIQHAIEVIKTYPISYIYVGPDELQQYGDGVNKFENQNYFERIYFNDLVKIYRLKPELT